MKKKKKREKDGANWEGSLWQRTMKDVSLRVGDCVQMSEELKMLLSWGGSDDHVEEFGGCSGTIDSGVKGLGATSPTIDVRWQPSGLCYGYDPRLLLVKREKSK